VRLVIDFLKRALATTYGEAAMSAHHRRQRRARS
jgi:hypothetical protein